MTSRRTSPPLTLTVVGVETHADPITWPSSTTRWTLWLSYVGSIGEVVATGQEHDWEWSCHPLTVAA